MRWEIIAAIGGLLWVIIGAATGHGMLHDESAVWMEKAQRYQIVHVLALFWLGNRSSVVAWLWIIGVILFSGSLYIMSLTGPSAIRFVVPVGGMLILAGWAYLVFVLWR